MSKVILAFSKNKGEYGKSHKYPLHQETRSKTLFWGADNRNLLKQGNPMKRKKEKKDHITTWLQRGYYFIAITNELDLASWLKATIAKFIDS